MVKNEFINCLLVNLTYGKLGDCHRALNTYIYAWWSFIFPFTRDICIGSKKFYKRDKQGFYFIPELN